MILEIPQPKSRKNYPSHTVILIHQKFRPFHYGWLRTGKSIPRNSMSEPECTMVKKHHKEKAKTRFLVAIFFPRCKFHEIWLEFTDLVNYAKKGCVRGWFVRASNVDVAIKAGHANQKADTHGLGCLQSQDGPVRHVWSPKGYLEIGIQSCYAALIALTFQTDIEHYENCLMYSHISVVSLHVCLNLYGAGVTDRLVTGLMNCLVKNSTIDAFRVYINDGYHKSVSRMICRSVLDGDLRFQHNVEWRIRPKLYTLDSAEWDSSL
ncbi:hypothetical protein CEXT_609521 [Caerostris extrusa]|uniref:Uncharacterized protein n=1 Tax=Caerostris extrusa TaxID=172846 RepID=A0AAV4SYV4_CAEEX|nr:hypothetical protein CEXT_609521 [Caerostris extrusa]